MITLNRELASLCLLTLPEGYGRVAGMKLSAAEKRVLGVHLFAWAVQQARLKAFISGSWTGPNDPVMELVAWALRTGNLS